MELFIFVVPTIETQHWPHVPAYSFVKIIKFQVKFVLEYRAVNFRQRALWSHIAKGRNDFAQPLQ
jgi:hypothetical protein